MKFSECEKAGVVEGFALIKSCDKKSAKNGTFYLDIKLGDKNSEMVAKLWDFKEDLHTLPEVNTVVKIRGTVQQYNGNDQFIIQRIRPAQDEEYDMSDFVKSSDYSGSDMLDSIVRIVNGFEDDELKKIAEGIEFMEKVKKGEVQIEQVPMSEVEIEELKNKMNRTQEETDYFEKLLLSERQLVRLKIN